EPTTMIVNSLTTGNVLQKRNHAHKRPRKQRHGPGRRCGAAHKKDRTARSSLFYRKMAGGLGFEPRLEESGLSVRTFADAPPFRYTLHHPTGKSQGPFYNFPPPTSTSP